VPENPLTIEKVLTQLAETPPRISSLTSGLNPAQLRAAPDHGEWSANDVLGHLRACVDVWGSSMMTIIAEDEPTLRAVNPRTWIKGTDYLEVEFRPSLRAFARQRADLLAALQPLRHEDWSRRATLTGAGKVLERTAIFYGQWLARHERSHLKQVESIVSRMRPCSSA